MSMERLPSEDGRPSNEYYATSIADIMNSQERMVDELLEVDYYDKHLDPNRTRLLRFFHLIFLGATLQFNRSIRNTRFGDSLFLAGFMKLHG